MMNINLFHLLKAFHAFGEICSLDDETLSRFRDRFRFPDRVRVRLSCREERTCHFSPRRYTSIRLLSFVGLDSPSTLSLWSC